MLLSSPWFPVNPSLTSHVTSPNPKVKIHVMICRLKAHIRLVSFPPFHGVFSLTTFQNASSDLHQAYLTRLCCVFRLSQPLDALFRSHSFGPISCRIRPWGWSFQRFPPLQSRHSFHCALPSALRSALRRLTFTPLRKAVFRKTLVGSASVPLRRASPQHNPIAMLGSGFIL